MPVVLLEMCIHAVSNDIYAYIVHIYMHFCRVTRVWFFYFCTLSSPAHHDAAPVARKRRALRSWCPHVWACHQSNEAFAVQAAVPEEAAVKRLGAADVVLVALAAYLLLWHMLRYLLRRRRRVAPQPGAHEQ